MGRFRSEVPELAAVLDGADHVDVKSVESETGLREFVAAHGSQLVAAAP